MRRWWDVLPLEKFGELYHEVQCVEVATPTALTCKITSSIDFLTELGRTRLIDTGRRSSKRVLVPQPSDDPHDPLVSSPLYEQDRHDLLVEAIELKRYRTGILSGISTMTCAASATFVQGMRPLSLAFMISCCL